MVPTRESMQGRQGVVHVRGEEGHCNQLQGGRGA